MLHALRGPLATALLALGLAGGLAGPSPSAPASSSASAAPAADAGVSPAPIAPALAARPVAEAREFLLQLRERADLRGLPHAAGGRARRIERTRRLVEDLRAVAARSQAGLLARLAAAGVPHRSHWAANVIWVEADGALMSELALDPAVERVLANPAIRFEPPVEAGGIEAPAALAAVEWNIEHVGAPEVWLLGFRGQGVVVGGQDTGYQWDHPALISQYRGWDGAVADHAYNWHDAIHSSIGGCGADSPEPCDDNDHGTHTMGIVLGDDGGGNQIGMAPDARWIGCRNMDGGVGTPATYTECFEWFLAPTDATGLNPDPSFSPDIITNSWTCIPSEGCNDDSILRAVVTNVRAAGIAVVAAAGNGGPSCGTIVDPPALYPESFAVGSTRFDDLIAVNSSRGPALLGGEALRKPDISAPGVTIRSARKNSGYKTLSGTSMATPHVAGLMALMISANPMLAGDVDALEAIIRQTAVPLTTTNGCGGDGSSDVPNHTFGDGRIDALAAVQAAVVSIPGLAPPGVGVLALALGLSGALASRIAWRVSSRRRR